MWMKPGKLPVAAKDSGYSRNLKFDGSSLYAKPTKGITQNKCLFDLGHIEKCGFLHVV